MRDTGLWSQTTWTQTFMSFEKIWLSLLNSLKCHFLSYKMRSIQLPPRQYGGSLNLTSPTFYPSSFFCSRDLSQAQEWPGHLPVPNLPMSGEHRPNHKECHQLHPIETVLSQPCLVHLWSFASIHFSVQPPRNRFIMYLQCLTAVCVFKAPPQSFPVQNILPVLFHLANSWSSLQAKDISTSATFPTVPGVSPQGNKN